MRRGDVIVFHRDPLASSPSISSLYSAVWKVYSDRLDARACGEYCSNFYARSLRRMQEAQRRSPRSFVDIEYRELVEEPDAILVRLFDFMEKPLLPATLAAMQQWRSGNRRTVRAVHEYRPEEFCLSEVGIRAIFADYYALHDF